jgi:O-antigen ligase
VSVSERGDDLKPVLPWKDIAWFSLLAMVFTVPLASTNFTWLGYETPFTFDMLGTPKVFILRLGLLGATAAWAFYLVRAESAYIRRTPAVLPLLALLGWLTLTTALSIHPLTSVFGEHVRNGGLLTYGLYAGLFFLTAQLADRLSRVRQFATVVFVTGVIVAAYGLAQYAGLDPVSWPEVLFESRAFATFGNPGLLGSFLAFFIPVVIALGLAESRRPWRVLWLSGAVLGIAALVVTFARSAWIGGFVALVVLAVIAVRQRVVLDRVVDVAFAGAGALVAGLLAWMSARGADPTADVFQRLASLIDAAGGGEPRTEIYRSAFAALAERPFMGFGLDTFRLLFPAYRTAEFVRLSEYTAIADMAHSYPLQIAVTAGVPGLLLAGAFFGSVARASWPMVFGRSPDGERRSPGGRILMGGLWAGCAGYLASVLFGVSHPETDFLLWMAMGMLVAPGAVALPFDDRLRRPAVAGAVSAVVALALIGAGTAVYADNRYLHARLLPNGPGRLMAADSAVSIAPYLYTYRTHRGAAYAEAALTGVMQARSAGTPVTDDMRAEYTAAVEILLEATRFAPWDRDARYFLAAVYNAGGQAIDPAYHERALDALDQVADRMPNDPQFHYERAVALRGLGRPDDALREARISLDLEPRSAEAAVLAAELLAEGGKTGEALELLEESERTALNPSAVRDAQQRIEASPDAR